MATDSRGRVIRVGKRTRVVDLRATKIDGDLLILFPAENASAVLRLDGAAIGGNIVIRGSGQNSPPIIPPHRAAQFEARGMTVGGDLCIENIALRGAILNNARIGGDLRLLCVSIDASGVRPDGQPGDSLRARDIRVGGSMFLRGSPSRRSRLDSRLYLAGAKIEGTAEFTGVDFEAEGKAVTMANAVIGGDLAWLSSTRFGGRCSLGGRANLDSCHVGGRLRLAIEARPGAMVSMRACEIDAALQLYSSAGEVLDIDASDTSADAIIFHGLDEANWSLDVRGMHYQGLACTTVSGIDAAKPALSASLLDWFLVHIVRRSACRRDERDSAVPFSPQPYQAFVRLCRSEGFDRVADRAVTEWIRRTPKQFAMRPIFWLFRLLSGYGLHPGRATLTFLASVGLCWAVVANTLSANPQAFVDPEQRDVLERAPPQAPSAALARPPARKDGDRGSILLAQEPATFDCARRINTLVYAVEIMLPVSDFGQQSQCPPRGRSDAAPPDFRVWWFAVAITAFRILGAILIAIVLLTYSGINRRIWR